MLADRYLINGVFFQGQTGLALDPGSDVVVRSVFGSFHYWGMIWRISENLMGDYRGALSDQFGESCLRLAVVTDRQFRFSKRYVNRTDEIQYVFDRKDELLWEGRYSGERSGTGFTRCYLIPITDAFLTPPPEEVEAWRQRKVTAS